MTRVLLVCGDPSGDLYASLLTKAVFERAPDARVDGIGGPLLRQAIAGRGEFLEDLASLGVTGFVEPARKIPLFFRLLRRLRERFRSQRPDAVVCVDFYGFNSRVLAAAKAAKVPAYYFISPQVWASRPGRIARLKRLVERMLVIFPFEERIYQDAGVPTTWVGHPLLDLLPEPAHRVRPDGSLRLGLLPGSRPSELRRHMPVLLDAAARILARFPKAELTLFAADSLPDQAYEPWLGHPARPRLVRDRGYAERARLDFALTSSGTATLENALLGVPMVVVYKLSWPTYALARALIRVSHIAMVNILAKTELAPELIQADATGPKIAKTALELLENPERLAAVRHSMLELRAALGKPGACGRAADVLLREIAGRVPAPEHAHGPAR
ncbi:MAG TPA: lipid-A-disaccharide synthase [Elusimicrobiota bacterium]|nr:lipid-A-disaccharide synthase [Elusimicrobiota bacterium]